MFGQTFNNKKVLITGHTGFKGSWLSLWLHQLGATVLGISNKKVSSPSNYDTSKLDKIIPDLIFQMEQFDVNVIKLSNRLKTDKSFLAKLVKRSNVRDFRLKLGSVKNN